jgi:hypothetical protein
VDASATSFDNSALLNSVSAKIKRIRRRKDALKEARRMIGEDEQEERYRELIGAPPKMLNCDSAVFFYPGLDQGIPAAGPINPKEMCNTFFREDLPSIFPEAKEDMKKMSVREMTNAAIRHGMIVVFGEDGVLNQIMARNPSRAVRDFGTTKKVFDRVAEKLVWLDGYDSVAPNLIPSKEAVGTHLLAWRRA